MQDKQNKLLIEMVLKIDEARTYHRICGVITLVWLIEFFYTFFYTNNELYLVISNFFILYKNYIYKKKS